MRANAQQPKLFVGMILILIFAEALALYGLIGEGPWGALAGRAPAAALARPAAAAGRESCSSAARQTLAAHLRLPLSPAPLPYLPPSLAVGIILASKAGTAVPMST